MAEARRPAVDHRADLADRAAGRCSRCPVWIAIFTAYNLYERQNRSISLATFDEVGELFHALLAGSLCSS